MAGPTGFEPATSGLTGQRANQTAPRPRERMLPEEVGNRQYNTRREGREPPEERFRPSGPPQLKNSVARSITSSAHPQHRVKPDPACP